MEWKEEKKTTEKSDGIIMLYVNYPTFTSFMTAACHTTIIATLIFICFLWFFNSIYIFYRLDDVFPSTRCAMHIHIHPATHNHALPLWSSNEILQNNSTHNRCILFIIFTIGLGVQSMRVPPTSYSPLSRTTPFDVLSLIVHIRAIYVVTFLY